MLLISNIANGLRKGIAILVYYVVGSTHYQVVLLAHDSVLGKSGKQNNRLACYPDRH